MALKQDTAILEAIPFFAALGADPLRLIAFSAQPRRLRDGDTLFRQGDPSDGGYVVTEGTIMLQVAAGNQPPVSVGRGTLIGEVALVVETICPATAWARGDTSVLHISRAIFHKVLDEFPAAAGMVRAIIAQQTQMTATRLAKVRQALNAIHRKEAKRQG